MDTIKSIINRIKGLQQFVVQVTLPPAFRFNGTVPFDMEIVGNIAMVTVWASTQTEAETRAKEFFNPTDI
jgi:hypothetical protein